MEGLKDPREIEIEADYRSRHPACAKCGHPQSDHDWPRNQGIWQLQHRFVPPE